LFLLIHLKNFGMKLSIKNMFSLVIALVIGAVTFANVAVQSFDDGDSFGKKQLVTCTKTSGDVVVKVGNTCDPSGKGCETNPCY
jgi:hypothetical protein